MVTAILVAATTMLPIPPAAADVVVSGTCLLDLQAAYATAAALLPADDQVTVTDPGGNYCATTAGMATVSMWGTLTTPALTGKWGCFAGEVDGWLKVRLDVANFPNPVTEAIVVNVGGALVLVSESPVIEFQGAGALAQGPLDLAGCASGGSITSTHWTGALVFHHPYL
jgi:hypothetical protein